MISHCNGARFTERAQDGGDCPVINDFERLGIHSSESHFRCSLEILSGNGDNIPGLSLFRSKGQYFRPLGYCHGRRRVIGIGPKTLFFASRRQQRDAGER